MNELIGKLSNIDEKAVTILTDAQNRSAQLNKKMELEQSQMDELLEEQRGDIFSKLRAEYEAKVQRENERQERNITEKIAGMQQKYESSREKMEEEILHRILGV